MLHVKGLSFDGVVGKSPIATAAETLGISIALDKHAGAFFKNGASVGGILKHPGTLKQLNVLENLGLVITQERIIQERQLFLKKEWISKLELFRITKHSFLKVDNIRFLRFVEYLECLIT